jgi:hypothetical protein
VRNARILIVCSLLGLFYVGPMALLPIAANAIEESISGRSYLAIQTAAAELVRNDLDISRYRITVIEAETALFVIFIDADVPDDTKRGVRGNPSRIPGFEVELTRNNLRVVRSHFIR